MKNILSFMFIFIIIGPAAAADDLAVGDQVPPLSLFDLDSNLILGSKLYGSAVLVFVFWESSCEKCKVQMKEMELLQEEYSVSNVRIYFTAADRNQMAVRDIYDRLNFTLPCLLDSMKVYYYDYIPSLELSGKLVVPRTYIIGLDKTISYIHYGFDTSHKKDEIALIKAAIDSCLE